MTPTYDKIHNRFKLNGLHFDREELKEVAYSYIKEGEAFEKEMGDFLLEWTNDREVVEVASALDTCNYFNLEP